MADRNFSHKTLAQKLGIKPGDEVTVLNSPENYLNLIGLSIIPIFNLHPDAHFIHYFAKTKEDLEKDFPKLKKSLAKAGMIWISNKKGESEFGQQDVQKIGLKNGLVDVKVVSINENWSAMKFVYRLKDR